MIRSVRCQNYRSLEDVELPLAPLTALVGPNGSGKTALLRAIGLLLGDFWPSLRSIRVPNDFTGFDAKRALMIETSFDPPLETTSKDALGKTYKIERFVAKCQPYKRATKTAAEGDLHFDFVPLGPEGKRVMTATRASKGTKPDFSPLLQVSSGLRDQSRVLMIDHRRSLAQHLPSLRGSVLGRLFEPARKEFEADPASQEEFAKRYEAAMQAIRTPKVQDVEQTIAATAKRMIGFMGTDILENVEIAFGFADPANPFNSLRLMYREGGLDMPGDELGLGVQSAMVVGIFEALRQLGGEIGTVLIEEPEMYLHPQAQRYFFGILTELADRGDCQVVYSTHSPIFADISRFESIRLVRKEPGASTTVSFVKRDEDAKYLSKQRARQKLIGFDSSRSELLFARRALLVEGPGDKLATHIVANLLGKDPDAEDLAIVPCGSKSAIPFFARVCGALGIPVVVLHDDDIYPEPGRDDDALQKVRDQNAQAEKLNAEVKSAAADAQLFVLSPSLEGVLGIGKDAADKPRRVFEALEELAADELPEPLRGAVVALFDPVDG